MTDQSAVAPPKPGEKTHEHKAEEKPHEPILPTLSPELMKHTRLYELCLLFDPAEASRTWDKLVEWVNEIIGKRYGQHVLRVDKWADSRKLAYEIRGLKRGTYMVVWFRSLPKFINEIERDCRLDEKVIRHIIIAHEEEPPTVGKTADDFDQAPLRREDDDLGLGLGRDE
jgi:ribosomal protein S6